LSDNPIPQVAYGKLLPKLSAREAVLQADPKEAEVRTIFQQRADDYQQRLDNLPASWEAGRRDAQRRLDQVKTRNASLPDIRSAEPTLISYPKSPDMAASEWTEAHAYILGRARPITPRAEPYAGDAQTSPIKRNNFVALVFCLMLGTVA